MPDDADHDETVRRETPDAPVVRLKIRRQDAPDQPETRRWEQFDVPRKPRMTVVGALRAIQENPVTVDGREVAPVAWEPGCLDEACGACTVLIGGAARPACSVLLERVAPKKGPVVLEPLSKFPVVRDLVVDRSRLFDDLKRVHAWITIEGTASRAAPPRQSPELSEQRYVLSRCTSCGACLEACPQYGDQSDFIGAAALNQVRLFNLHPTGRSERGARLEAVMGPGGVADCGKAQNCVEVCPVGVPLVDSIQRVARETSRQLVWGWLLQ